MTNKFNIGDRVEVASGGYAGSKGIIIKVYRDPKDGTYSYAIKSTRIIGYSYSVGTELTFMESILELVEGRALNRINYKDVENYDEIEVVFFSSDLKRTFSGVVMTTQTSNNGTVTEFFTEGGQKLFSTKWSGVEVYLIKKGNPPHPLEGAKVGTKIRIDKGGDSYEELLKHREDNWICDVFYKATNEVGYTSLCNESYARNVFDNFRGRIL